MIMLCTTEKTYHEQTDFVIKREQQLKAEKLAARCLDSKTPDI